LKIIKKRIYTFQQLGAFRQNRSRVILVLYRVISSILNCMFSI
jgi:hypothetical protein